jgi:hypothetical protein
VTNNVPFQSQYNGTNEFIFIRINTINTSRVYSDVYQDRNDSLMMEGPNDRRNFSIHLFACLFHPIRNGIWKATMREPRANQTISIESAASSLIPESRAKCQ